MKPRSNDAVKVIGGAAALIFLLSALHGANLSVFNANKPGADTGLTQSLPTNSTAELGNSPPKGTTDDSRQSTEGIMKSSSASHKLSPTARVHCVIYDRPPRTGSSTTSVALRECLVDKHGFAEPKYSFGHEANAQVGKLFTQVKGGRRALLSKHLRITAEDARLIRKNCRTALFLTNCRPMAERIWSKVKFKQSLAGSELSEINWINSTLNESQLRAALNAIDAGEQGYEKQMEMHPYINVRHKAAEISDEERFVPDYVLRNAGGLFNEDLGNLLKALGCEANFTTSNIHASNIDDSDIVQRIEGMLMKGDAKYKELRKLGDEGNAEGLRKATAFLENSRTS